MSADVSSRVRDVVTRFSSVAYLLRETAKGNEYRRSLAKDETETLLWMVLGEAVELVELLGAYDQYSYEEYVREHAHDLYEALYARERTANQRALLAKLDHLADNTSFPEEAATAKRKADQLRERIG